MSQPIEVKVPDIGDFKNIDVIEVLVAPGDTIQTETPLVTLESEKATMDVPAPVAGTIKEIRIDVGQQVSEGSVILVMEVDEPGIVGSKSGIESSTVNKGSLSPTTTEPMAAVIPPSPTPPLPPLSLPSPVDQIRDPIPHASPAVRRFARELGADIRQIHGSGPKGRILREDIQQFVKTTLARSDNSSAATLTSVIPQSPEINFSNWGEIEIKPLSRIQRTSGSHLHRAWLNIPHVTYHDEVDITDLEAFRKSLKPEFEKSGIRVTLLVFLLKGLTAALKEFPTFNASLSSDGASLILKHYYHIGIAVDTPRGLIVPVIRDVDQKGIMELAAEMEEISARARDGKIRPDDLQGGCITISNLGGIGGTAVTPIVNLPEVAILGVTRSRITPVWNGMEFKPCLMLPLDLSYDHRVIDGAIAARFVTFLRSSLEDARRLLL